MREDEEFVKDKIVEALSCEFDSIKVNIGDEPPDYYLKCDELSIALEVTQCKPLIIRGNEYVEAETDISSIVRLINRLDAQYGSLFIDNQYIIFRICFPIINYRKFKKGIEHYISNRIFDMLPLDVLTELEIGDEIIGCTKSIKLHGKRIVSIIFPSYSTHEIDVDQHVYSIVNKAVNIKTEKFKKNRIKPVDGIWLGLYNDYCLAEWDNYENAISCMDISSFSRVFVVHPNGEVQSFGGEKDAIHW